MILSCNSCEKKFIVPDNAITNTGRLVQCSSCGNKWKQFPIRKEGFFKEANKVSKVSKIPKNTSKRKNKKRSEPSLYTPEYLAKKHGIKINDNDTVNKEKKGIITNTNFGFYNSIVVSTILLILLLRLLYFSQDILVRKYPFFEIYINYLFESIENIKEIIFNFFFGY